MGKVRLTNVAVTLHHCPDQSRPTNFSIGCARLKGLSGKWGGYYTSLPRPKSSDKLYNRLRQIEKNLSDDRPKKKPPPDHQDPTGVTYVNIVQRLLSRNPSCNAAVLRLTFGCVVGWAHGVCFTEAFSGKA